jgi:hypothetical protein
LPEASYLSRFFTKFVEIVAGGLATAMCAYLIAYLGIPLAPTAPAAVSAGPTLVTSSSARPPAPVAAPPVAALAVDEERRGPQPVADAPAQPARKAEKAAMAAAAPKDIKTGTNAARSDKSVEALARAALANVDADRPATADVPLRRNPVDIPPPVVAVEVPPRVAAIAPLPPNAGSPPELAALQPEPPAEEARGLFSIPKRILGLLRPGTVSFAGEAPRPPLPVGTPE